ncbi:Gfo/Idh/MocA family oxidoreductase [Amycolatopsis sp.]|uniref:Gfo/Idh/MocA family protein n=1 Tax=Amycolatopsis sp. TaxID=37632 RepID=UPI002C0C22A6|nr:Gfo/Idh/MocA family oxidoreductase [Amycolatopsis sp.]HVV12990.1 Gfo/Idh/MocA family oxidoreductase [Amycolatopsis sp.]
MTGVAVIGAGMAGRAHAAGYRSAGTVFDLDRSPVRLVAISDLNTALAEDARRRYGFERVEQDWHAIAEAPDIDAVSVVVANQLHREMLETLLAAGKHVLCEKPLAPTAADGRAMAEAARRTDRVAVVGYTYRRSPAVSAIREALTGGRLGDPVHFNGHAWYDYAFDPLTPLTWRYRGGPGSGILADTGSHLLDLAEYLCGPVTEISGGRLETVIPRRPIPAGPTVGHARAELTGEYAAVENEDVVTFTAKFANGALGTFSASRVAHGMPDGLALELFCGKGSAAFNLHRPGEFTISDEAPRAELNGHRTVYVGPAHPYIHNGLPMDSPGAGHGTADLFTYQARSFLDQIAGIKELPPCATLDEGAHGLAVLEAVVTSAHNGGAAVTIGRNG